jgi:sporulation protein YlmC with PRC-barrel domain
MKSRWLIAILGVGLVSLGTAALLADRPAATGEPRTGVQPAHPEMQPATSGEHGAACRTSGLIGMEVKNAAGKDLGVIEDLVINSKTGGICYAALARGGFLSGGKKLYAVPWNAFELRKVAREHLGFRGEGATESTVASKGEVELILKIDPTVLDKKEGFNRDKWPEAGDPSFAEHMLKSPTNGRVKSTTPESMPPERTGD